MKTFSKPYKYADYLDQETICRIVEWIVDIEYRPKSIDLQLFQFDPNGFSVENCKKFISVGFNPKWQLYNYADKAAKSRNSNWQRKLGEKYDELDDSFWFSPNQLTCGDDCLPDCNDKNNKFEFGAGLRVSKVDPIGSGGFGTVFMAKFHKKKVAAKYIEVSKSYRENICKYVAGESPQKIVAKLFGETAHEVQVYLSGQLRRRFLVWTNFGTR